MNLVYNPTPGGQAELAHRSRARVKLVYGPFRSGKSTFAIWRVIQKCRAAAAAGISARCLFVRDTYTNLRDTTLQSWMEWAGPAGSYNKADHIFELGIGGITHQIFFRHGQTAKDASKFLSSEYAIAVLEEPVPAFLPSGSVSPGIDEDVFDLLLGRLIQKGINYTELVIPCNPPTPRHWVNRRILQLPKEELAKLNWDWWIFSQEENKENLREGYYDELELAYARRPDLQRRFVFGEIVAIYPGVPVYAKVFSSTIHLRNDLEPLKDRPLVLCWDNPPTPACVITQVAPNGQWRVLQELQGGFYEGKITAAVGIREFARQVMQTLRERYAGMKMAAGYGDPALNGPSNEGSKGETQRLVDILAEEGFQVRTTNPNDTASRQESLRAKLTALIDGEPSVVINRSLCPLISEGLAGGYRYNTTPDQTRLVGGDAVKNEFSHCVEAVEQGAMGIFGVVKPFSPGDSKRRPLQPPSAMSA